MKDYNDYPIRYAVLELRKKEGWAVDYEYVTQGYIASKCYVVGSKLFYGRKESRVESNVVFPYEDIELFKKTSSLGEEQVPTYTSDGELANMRIVSKVYETFEEAKEAAEKENENYKDSLLYKVDISREGWKIELDKLQEDFERNLNICYLFEEASLDHTKDLIVESNTKSLKKIEQ